MELLFDLEHPLLLSNFKRHTTENEHINNDDVSCPSVLFSLESEHNPLENLQDHQEFDVSVRRVAVTTIFNLCSRQYSNPFISYLSVNYFDRFFSTQEVVPLVLQLKAWTVKLIATICVSLAVKMIKPEANIANLQCGEEEGFIFDCETIERMEIVILGKLNWRMRSITPFCFINSFISLFNFNTDLSHQRHALKFRAVHIILNAQLEIKLLEFNPSVVAASALLSACHELGFPLQSYFPCFLDALSTPPLSVNQENLEKCCNSMAMLGISKLGLSESIIELGGSYSRQSSGSSCCNSRRIDGGGLESNNRVITNGSKIVNSSCKRHDNRSCCSKRKISSGGAILERRCKRQRTVRNGSGCCSSTLSC